MFTVLKLIKPFLLPPTLIACGMATSLFLFFRGKYRLGKILLTIVFLIYYLLSIGPVAFFLSRSLEAKNVVKESEINLVKIEAIVILSGGVSKKGGYRPFHELSGISWRRLWHGVEVYKKLKGQVPILYAGGSANPFDPISVEAELAKSYAVSIGIPNEKFWIEKSSRNTYESGLAIKRILDERFPAIEKHNIILVTSATHMPRSVGVMKKIGFYTIPSPADFAISSLSISPLSFIPSIGNFFTSYLSIHEWIGIGGYWLLGRI